MKTSKVKLAAVAFINVGAESAVTYTMAVGQ